MDINPSVSESLRRVLGITIKELNEDISKRLVKGPLLGIRVEHNMPYKEAKRRFRQEYLARMLNQNYGNVSRVAELVGMDRRSLHRIIQEAEIDVDKIRSDMLKPQYVKETWVKDMIGDILKGYSEVLHPKKLEMFYENAAALSKDLLSELPPGNMTMKDAEEEFDRLYLEKALISTNYDLQLAAQKVGLRYETLLRKAKKLGLTQ